MPLPYREFATWILSDLAERTPTKHKDRITFSGNHISIQYPIPVRAESETEEEFAMRVRDFYRGLPRYSDLSFPMTMAWQALVLAGKSDWSAASLVLGELQKVPVRSKR